MCSTNLFKKKTGREESRIVEVETKAPVLVPGEDFKLKEPEKDVELWYPGKAAYSGPKAFTRGLYDRGYPLGACVHYSASRNDPHALLKYAVHKGYTFFLIDRSGNIFQNFPLNEWGYHCGKSSWPGLGKKSLNDKIVGIEMISSGHLSWKDDLKATTWWGQTVLSDEIREIEKDVGSVKKGSYHKFTDQQEVALVNLLLWLEKNGRGIFKFDNVLGHMEISPRRKLDPGGSLSFTMKALRECLHELKSLNKSNIQTIGISEGLL